MKKIFLPFVIFCLLTIVFIGGPTLGSLARADGNGYGLVGCDTGCTLDNFFTMLRNIYSFIVKDIATPLAVLAVMIGGILMLISAGNPNLMSLGKQILYSAIIGLVLTFGSLLIINTILSALGAKTI